jgi:hypothetical protein
VEESAASILIKLAPPPFKPNPLGVVKKVKENPHLGRKLFLIK